MTTSPLFPGKSRLQVAICLEKLLVAYTHLDACRALTVSAGNDQAAELFAALSVLTLYRLLYLIRPCLFVSAAISYRHTDRLRVKGLGGYLLTVRGWKRRVPAMLKSRQGG